MVPNRPPRDPVAISTDHALCLHRVDHMLHMKQKLLALGCRSHHPEQFEQGHGPRLHENHQFQSTRWACWLFCFQVSPPAFAFSWTFQDLQDGIKANRFMPVAENRIASGNSWHLYLWENFHLFRKLHHAINLDTISKTKGCSNSGTLSSIRKKRGMKCCLIVSTCDCQTFLLAARSFSIGANPLAMQACASSNPKSN